MLHFWKRLFRARNGATAIEYGMILACIAISLIVALRTLNAQSGNIFGNSASAVAAAR